MRVFISHQKQDSEVSAVIATRLKTYHQIDSYLDVIDPFLSKPGEDLADHIRVQMGKCTQLLAVISNATRLSQWVPWEIGVATEKDFPLATYSDTTNSIPEFLQRWPVLTSQTALDQYAIASKSAANAFLMRRATLHETASVSQRTSTRSFYTDLRRRLNQY
jgi:hypothetical protein